MKKPRPLPARRFVKPAAYDYHEMIGYLEDKYGFESRDYFGSSYHFVEWAKSHRKPKKDADGKDWGSSQIFYAEYKKAPDGAARRPPYCDFWHWLLSVEDSIHNDCQIMFRAKAWLAALARENDPAREWIQHILEYVAADFGDEFDVHIAW